MRGDQLDFFTDRSGCHDPAYPPPKHVEGLTCRLDCDGAVPHALQSRQADVRQPIEKKMLIGFVHQHQQVMFDRDLGDGFQINAVKHAPSRVVRVTKDQHFRARCDALDQVVHAKTKAILLAQGQGYRLST